MLAFKIMDDPFVGTLTFCRIYSGKLQSGHGAAQHDARTRRERIGRMLLMHANNREDIKEAFAGDIVALVGLKDTRTGDTLCDPQKPVILERMEFPEPVIEIAIEPKSKADQEKMGSALQQARGRGPVLPRHDRPGIRPDDHQGHGRAPSRHHGRHPEARPTRSRPMSARRRWPIARRSPRRAEIDYTHKKQTGGTGQFARVKIMRFEPTEPGAGFEFENEIVGGNVPKEYVPGVEKGLERVMDSGVLAGFPMVDIKATLIDGAYHEVDSSALAFEIAGARPSAKALQKARPVLLEPIMKVEVVTPDDYARRRHRRPELAPRPDPGHGHARQRARSSTRWCRSPTCSATSTTLRSMSQGRAQLHDAVRPLRAGAEPGRRRNPSQVRLIESAQARGVRRRELMAQREIRAQQAARATSARSVTSTTARRR